MPCGAYDFVSVELASKFIMLATRTAERLAPMVASSRPCSDCCRSDSYFSFATSCSWVSFSALEVSVRAGVGERRGAQDGAVLVDDGDVLGLEPFDRARDELGDAANLCGPSCMPGLVWIAIEAVVGSWVVE